MSAIIKKNPFAVQTPEDMAAKDVNELFVDVFTDFYQVPRQGHTFLNGPRGSGKSMMFRYMEPDCLSFPCKDGVMLDCSCVPPFKRQKRRQIVMTYRLCGLFLLGIAFD